MIDLIGYRRWGHNEGDEPAFTQPRMYAVIRSHPTVRQLWAEELARQGVVTGSEADAMLQEAMQKLEQARTGATGVDEEEEEGTPVRSGRGGGAAVAAPRRTARR